LLSPSDCVEWLMPVETNIIIFKLKDEFPAEQFAGRLKEQDILCIAIGKNQIRMVTHLDFDDAMLQQVKDALKKISI